MNLWSFVTWAVGLWAKVKKVMSGFDLYLVELIRTPWFYFGWSQRAGPTVQRWLLLQKE